MICNQASLFTSVYIDLSAQFPPLSLGVFEPLTLILSFGSVRMTEVMLLGCTSENWWWQWQLSGLQESSSVWVMLPNYFNLSNQFKKKWKEAVNLKALITPKMRRVYNGGMVAEQTPLLLLRASYFKLHGSNIFTLWSERQRLMWLNTITLVGLLWTLPAVWEGSPWQDTL